MDEKLYYETIVTLSHEVKAAYDHAVANNIPNYRCIAAKDGSIFGWDNEGAGKYVRAQEGQEWFKNPEYKEPENEIAPDISFNETVLQEEIPCKETVEEVAEKPAAESTESIENSAENTVNVEVVDYETLYKEEHSKYESLRADYDFAIAELNSIRTAILTLTKEFKEAQDKLGE